MLRRTINGCMIDFIIGVKMMGWDTRAMGFVVDVIRGLSLQRARLGCILNVYYQGQKIHKIVCCR